MVRHLKRLVSAVLVGIVVLTAMPTFLYAADEDEEEYFSPIDYEDDYISFGDSEHDPEEPFCGIECSVDESSLGAYWVDLHVSLEDNRMIETKKIDKFLILANGKVIDTFYPRWVKDYDGDGQDDPMGWYKVKPFSYAFIGTNISFQIVAVTFEPMGINLTDNITVNAQYAVAWSNITRGVTFKPLPVIDNAAVSLLQQILNKLGQLLDTLAYKLDRIADQISTMFTPSQQAQQRFEKAQNDLYDKLPMKDQIEQNKNMKDLFEDSKKTLEEPYSRLTFGEYRDWFMIGQPMYLIDLTAFKSQIEMIRKLLDAIVWVEFFMFLVFYLAPKLQL